VSTAEPRPNWTRRLLIGVGIVVAVILCGLIASATIPRWWAQRIGDQVDGSITQGVLVGLFYGFAFTALPMLVLIGVLRWRRTWKTLVAAVGAAVILASPNLMTLGIVLGSGNAAHAGERTLDVEAPAFRGASLVGALLAIALVGFVGYLLVSRRKARAAAYRAEHPHERREHEERDKPDEPEEPEPEG
jgi:hypothetical protein